MKTSDKVHELFLNYACNAKCPFCYNPPITPELLRRELSFDEAAQSLYRGARSGARRLNLHGGEVTLRDDLPKILRLARKIGFSEATLVTNGVRLAQPGYVPGLVEAGATHFRLSVHGPDERTHDAIVAIPGAFARVLEAIENIRAVGAPLGMNFVLIEQNYRAFPAFLERFCLQSGVDDVIVYFPHLRGMMEINAETSGLTYAKAVPFVRQGAAMLERAGKRSALLLANFVPCVLPELADRMLDWSRQNGQAATMTHPEGFTQDLHEMKDDQRAAVQACRDCVLSARCMGVEKAYLSRRGEEDFASLSSDPEAARA